MQPSETIKNQIHELEELNRALKARMKFNKLGYFIPYPWQTTLLHKIGRAHV
jgi:hypothetical protein